MRLPWWPLRWTRPTYHHQSRESCGIWVRPALFWELSVSLTCSSLLLFGGSVLAIYCPPHSLQAKVLSSKSSGLGKEAWMRANQSCLGLRLWCGDSGIPSLSLKDTGCCFESRKCEQARVGGLVLPWLSGGERSGTLEFSITLTATPGTRGQNCSRQ